MANILIVDDDNEMVALLSEALSRDGHEISSAAEPVEGMQKCRSLHPDLIVLDYHMPGATGAHLFESIRRNQSSQKTPILFLSGEAHPETILAEIADPELAQFLAKPVRLEELRRTVTEMLQPHG